MFPADNGGYEIKSYKIYITEDDQERFQAEVAGTSYTQEGLENGKTYYYAISAVNSLGESDKTDKIEVTPGVPPGTPTVSAQGLNGQVHLSWTLDDDGGIPVMYFNIFRRDTQSTGMSFLSESYETAYDDLAVINGNTYFYSVSAVNPKGEGKRSDEISAAPEGDGRAPGIPSNFSLTSGNAFVSLSWNVPSDTGGLKDLDYPVYRGTSASDLALITISPGLGFNDTTVLNGVTYSYAVSSRNIKGEGKRSNLLTATPIGNGRLPVAPSNLSAVKQEGFIQLNWEAPSDTGGLQISGYNVYRKNDDQEPGLIGHAQNAGYIDSDFQDGINYYYSITALNDLGEGPNSTTVNITIYDVPSMVQDLKAVTGNKYVNLGWHAPASNGGINMIGYNIYRGTQIQAIPFVKSSSGPGFNDTGLSNGIKYYYRICAKNDLGEGPLSEIINATPGTVPGKPHNLTIRLTGGKAVLSWEPPGDTGGFPILEYRIYRGDSEGNIQFIASSKSALYSDGNLTHGKRYYFRITSSNEKGEGPASTTVSVVNPGQTPASSNPPLYLLVTILLIITIIGLIIALTRRKKRKT